MKKKFRLKKGNCYDGDDEITEWILDKTTKVNPVSNFPIYTNEYDVIVEIRRKQK